MKKVFLFFVTLLMLCGVAAAGTVTFQWDAVEGATGYRVFVRPANGTYNYATPTREVTALTSTVTLPGGMYAAVARAYNAEGESGDSNEVLFGLVPNAPQNFTISFQ